MKRITFFLFILLSIGHKGSFAQSALDFDGVNDNATASAVMTQTDNLTLEAWIKPSESNSYNWIVCLDVSSLAIGTVNGYLTYLVNNSNDGSKPTSFSTSPSSFFTNTAYWNSNVKRSAGVHLTGGMAVIEPSPIIGEGNAAVNNLLVRSGSVRLSHDSMSTDVQSISIDLSSRGMFWIEIEV